MPVSYVESANPEGERRYLAASSNGASPSDPARIIHAIEPKDCPSVPITITAAGTTTLVSGVAAKKIRVENIILSADAACEVVFNSNATAKTGKFYLAARTPLSVAEIGGIFECTAAEDLRVVVTAAGAFNLGGVVSYRMVDS
jgi:hypothetical protein